MTQLTDEDDDDTSGAVSYRTARRIPKRPAWRTWLIGRPLPTADAPHQTISKTVGLAVFGADALSSIAYAPQETLVILAAAGTSALGYAFPISLIITALLAIVTISYQQTVHAYPNGGGSYIVARENLGRLPALTAGAALLMDYVLLAAVAVSSGVAQIVSAYPVLFPHRVLLALGLLALIMIANLRGVKESGATFAAPTYFFLMMMVLMVGAGVFRLLTGSLGAVVDPPPIDVVHMAQPLSLFLLLRAFASGTTALTGVECISDGVTAFKEPRAQNAGQTMIWMSTILGTLFLGIVYLLGVIGAVPSEQETVISQLARTVFGDRGLLYLGAIVATTVILILATNTAYADFPRLSAIIAADSFMPRQFAYRGSRLVFSRGIAALTAIAALLIVAFNASVTALIPLWAVGVFLSFTVSQAAMARRWWRSRDKGHANHDSGWHWKLVVNAVGAVCTAVVTIIFAATKFADGAWIIVLLLPVLVGSFYLINRHYRRVAQQLSLEDYGQPPRTVRHRVVVPVAAIHRGTLAAVEYAQSISSDVTVVHVQIDASQTDEVRHQWDWWGNGVRLVIIESPYRAFLEPFLEYVDGLYAILQPDERLTIVVPQFTPEHWWHNLLHEQTAFWMRFALLNKRGIVISELPYKVD